jgi:transcription-repair coupling factor (superfamily II helicase)
VGRGKLRAYAYFLLPPQRELTPAATRRLEVMQSFDTLGAGFTLASHDMDIRGFGNLVGEEQSGHIREVGIELYQQMLEEAVSGLKSETVHAKSEEWSPQINLGMAVLIPETYVEDLNLRMGLYRRAAALATPADIDSFAAELIDRFGKLPEEVSHLLDTVRLKQLCRAAGIARIDAGPKGAVIGFYLDKFDHPEKLLAYIGKHPTMLKLRPDQKLVYLQEAASLEEITRLLEDIASLRA